MNSDNDNIISSYEHKRTRAHGWYDACDSFHKAGLISLTPFVGTDYADGGHTCDLVIIHKH